MDVVRTLAKYILLSPREREASRAAFHVLDLMRHHGFSFAAATRQAGTTPASVHSYVGPALERRNGRWVARPADRLVRVMQVLAVGGVEHQVVLRGSRVASLLGGHWSAIALYLDTGDASRLAAFKGKRVAGYVLETDTDAIDEWSHRGELQIEDIYSLMS